MALINSLNQSNLGLGGATPNGFNTNVSPLSNSLGSTQLDINDGATPIPYGAANLVNSLNQTQLDINDGATPTQYINNLPQ
jgi:hypothetical protein